MGFLLLPNLVLIMCLSTNSSVDMSSNIKSIASVTHPIHFEFGDAMNKAKVTLAQQDSAIPLGKDFEMLVTLANPHM